MLQFHDDRAPILLSMLTAGVCVLLQANPSSARSDTTLTWYGHSAFSLTSPGGTVVLMDPCSDRLGYAMPRLRADAVTVSHEHFDHNAVEKATGKPLVLRGLSPDKRRWRTIDEQVGDVRIRAIPSNHDDASGKERGHNTIFIFETAGLRIVHLGDLGHQPSAATLQRIGPLDVVLLPVGGHFTLGAGEATRLVRSLGKGVRVIPMHYKTQGLKMPLPLATAAAFLKRHSGKVRHRKTNRLSLTHKLRSSQSEIIVLGYR